MFVFSMIVCSHVVNGSPCPKKSSFLQLSLTAVFKETSYYIIYLREQCISIYIRAYILTNTQNECSELNISNLQDQNSDLQKKDWHCQLIFNRLLFLFFRFQFLFALLALETQSFSDAGVRQ